MSVIYQFISTTDEEKSGILSDDKNLEVMVNAITEELNSDSEDETHKFLLLVVLEENASHLLAKQER